jgi:chaperone BCS1
MFCYSGVREDELENYGEEFLSKLPKSTVTPAELQGFLLNCKESPSRAVEDADAWIAKNTSFKRRSARQRDQRKHLERL